LGQEGSNIKSAYQLLKAVHELESGMGMKIWKEGFESFSEGVLNVFLLYPILTENTIFLTEKNQTNLP